MVLLSHRVAAARPGPASTGIPTSSPGSASTAPGGVEFGPDVRARDDDAVEGIEAEPKGAFEMAARGEGRDE
jgi:hypothetical protein